MMPRITPVDCSTLLRIFELYGCQYKRKKGSHHILIYPGAKRAVVIPEYDEIDSEIIKNNYEHSRYDTRGLFRASKTSMTARMPSLAIRADSTPHIGTGGIMCCIAL
jgi:predicted RNA binding protein YcfA (HicA-like mRNA interferase family)